MTVTEATSASLLSQPYHDGSCIVEEPGELGGDAVVRLRAPRSVEGALVRYVCDGEPRVAVAERDEDDGAGVWWRARFPVENPVTRYRWLLSGADRPVAWLNGRGVVPHDVSDDEDFVIGIDRGGPDWHLGSVVYEIFPDRFASSGLDVEPPEWAIPRGWDDLPTGRGPETGHEWFGGDLRGIEQRLDHIESLGASLLYLTPVFPARTTHRYDATTFEHVDPLLGGDEALDSLTAAAHARGLRVVGDLTLNHVGSSHGWFQAALADPTSPEHGFFYFDDSLPNGYASWMGVPYLPKLDHRSPELRRRLDEVVARWVRSPSGLDGWRIDVANMTGRYRDVDVNHEVAQATRAALTAAKTDALLVAEHGHDPRRDLLGGGWHGVMNYSGFLRPVWSWLREGEFEDVFYDMAAPVLEGPEAVEVMRTFRAGVPWPAVLHSWTLLCSHDTPRIATVVPSRERRLVGIGLQMTAPGVPMLFAGDEVGLEGAWGEDGRRTMPWDHAERWDDALLAEYRRLIALRRASPALAQGGIRYAFVGADAIAYLRESAEERLLCLASRADHPAVRLPLAELGCEDVESLYGGDVERSDGELILPADGPAFHVWRLEA